MRTRVQLAAIAATVIVATTLTPTAATAAPPTPGEQVAAVTLLDGLRVEAPSAADYNRDLFAEGLDLDGDGCRTRQEVLLEESQVPPIVSGTCTVGAGQWYSYYDNVTHTDPATLEMDHLVALKETWASGAWSWTDAQRQAYTNDTEDSRTLVMVTGAVNGAKADKDPATWLPPYGDAACRYVGEWVAVKWRWNLAVDEAEKTAVQNILAGCGSLSIVAPQLPADRPADPVPTPDPAAETKYYITKYDGTIWAVTAANVVALTFPQWQAAGAPTPLPAPTDYVKYAWSPTISAVTIFGTDKSRWIWKHVSAAEWKRAGNPKPRTAGWIEGSTYYQWAESTQIFVQDVGGKKHALTGAEWAASGHQPFEKRHTQGFVKLSWNTSIAFLTDYTNGKGGPINGARWTAEGNPAPVVKKRFPGDQVWKNYGSSTIYYAGPTVSKALTYSEWQAMGSPRPEVRGTPTAPTAPTAPPRPTRDKNCGDYASQAAAQADFNRYYPWYGDIFRLDGDNDRTACESYFG